MRAGMLRSGIAEPVVPAMRQARFESTTPVHGQTPARGAGLPRWRKRPAAEIRPRREESTVLTARYQSLIPAKEPPWHPLTSSRSSHSIPEDSLRDRADILPGLLDSYAILQPADRIIIVRRSARILASYICRNPNVRLIWKPKSRRQDSNH